MPGLVVWSLTITESWSGLLFSVPSNRTCVGYRHKALIILVYHGFEERSFWKKILDSRIRPVKFNSRNNDILTQISTFRENLKKRKPNHLHPKANDWSYYTNRLPEKKKSSWTFQGIHCNSIQWSVFCWKRLRANDLIRLENKYLVPLVYITGHFGRHAYLLESYPAITLL
jgi:hypothetical protein